MPQLVLPCGGISGPMGVIRSLGGDNLLPVQRTAIRAARITLSACKLRHPSGHQQVWSGTRGYPGVACMAAASAASAASSWPRPSRPRQEDFFGSRSELLDILRRMLIFIVPLVRGTFTLTGTDSSWGQSSLRALAYRCAHHCPCLIDRALVLLQTALVLSEPLLVWCTSLFIGQCSTVTELAALGPANIVIGENVGHPCMSGIVSPPTVSM